MDLSAWKKLSQTVLSTEQVRRVDQLAVEKFGMNSLVLMENAALGCVGWLRARFDNSPATVILAGNGNNGGDGFAIARHLQNMGWPVTVVGVGPTDKLSPDAKHNYEVLTRGNSDCVRFFSDSSQQIAELIGQSEVILDAMLGTGVKGEPREPFRTWIQCANRSKAERVAIDIPTGIDAETGKHGSVWFNTIATLTFVARKPAMVLPEISKRFGEIVVLPIGTPMSLHEELLRDAQPSS